MTSTPNPATFYRVHRPVVIAPHLHHKSVPVKHKRYPWGTKEKRMTIAAGFCVQDGILLCADSMYTGGTKVHQPKLFGHIIGTQDSADSCSIAFALAGHEDYGKMAIEECVEEIKDCPAELRSGRNIKQALRKAVKKINDEYVDKRPESYERENAKFELIIAAWLPRGGGLRMLKSNGPAVVAADFYHCTGAGAYLGDYLMRSVFDSWRYRMRIQDAALLAIQAFAAAKSYVADCGGDTQFLTVSHGGALSNNIPFNVADVEIYVSQFERLARKLLFDIGEGQANDAEFDESVEKFVQEVKRIRKYWRSGKAPWYQSLMEALSTGGIQVPSYPKRDSTNQLPSPE